MHFTLFQAGNICHVLKLHQPTYQLSSPPQLESQARAANARLVRATSAAYICWSNRCSASEVVLLFQLRFGAERSGANWAETTAIRVEPAAENTLAFLSAFVDSVNSVAHGSLLSNQNPITTGSCYQLCYCCEVHAKRQTSCTETSLQRHISFNRCMLLENATPPSWFQNTFSIVGNLFVFGLSGKLGLSFMTMSQGIGMSFIPSKIGWFVLSLLLILS
jgi:hypothetical protein